MFMHLAWDSRYHQLLYIYSNMDINTNTRTCIHTLHILKVYLNILVYVYLYAIDVSLSQSLGLEYIHVNIYICTPISISKNICTNIFKVHLNNRYMRISMLLALGYLNPWRLTIYLNTFVYISIPVYKHICIQNFQGILEHIYPAHIYVGNSSWIQRYLYKNILEYVNLSMCIVLSTYLLRCTWR